MHLILRRTRLIPCLVAGFLLAGPLAFRAADAQTITLQGADLQIGATSGWAGSGWGGYQPIRIEVDNRGAARELEFHISPPDEGRIPTVTRRLAIDEQATARFVMLVPVMSGYHSVGLNVLVDGEEVSGLRTNLTVIGRSVGAPPAVSLVYISNEFLDPRNFVVGASDIAPQWHDGSPSGGGYGYMRHLHGLSAGEQARAESVTPDTLPTSWVGYSATDMVAIDLATLREIRPLERDALFEWVATGGRLVIHEAGEFAGESSEFHKLLDEWNWTLPVAGWEPADPSHRAFEFLGVHPSASFSPSHPPSEGSPFGGFRQSDWGGFRDEEAHHFRRRQVEASWPREPRPFAVTRHVFGRVAVISDDLASANPADWNWLLTDLGGPAITWPMRHGIDSGAGDMEFINLPIPGVRGVPTIAFLVLISLFAILIGPVNYILLWRKGQLSRLVFTVPVLAVATSLLLFAYGALAHGFGTKGRVRSVTWIDAETNSATSISRMALFAGLAPSRGLQFSNDTAVYPLMPLGEEFQGGTIDWTSGQSLTEGWLQTRTRTQFVTVNHRDERGRLRVMQTDDGLTVVNGFTVPLEHVVVNDVRGRSYYGHNLPAGGKLRLTPMTDEQRAAMREVAIERIPEPPDGVEPRELKASLDNSYQREYDQRWQPQMLLSLLERHLGLIGSSSSAEPIPVVPEEELPEETNRVLAALRGDTLNPFALPRGFFAITAGNPGIEVGGLEVEEYESLHVLMGTW